MNKRHNYTTPPIQNSNALKRFGPPAFRSDAGIKEPRERYTPSAVKKHRNMDEDDYEERNGKLVKRHYIQQEALSNRHKIKTVLKRHSIPAQDQTWLVYAGFTGELAETLSEFGNDVIFTDPLEPWTTRAEESGKYRQVEQTTFESLPGSLIADSDGIITFEGFGPIGSENKTSLEVLRALTTQHGFTFFESEYTRSCTRSRGSGKSLKGTLNAFEQGYKQAINSQYRERYGLRAYNVRAQSDEVRVAILRDLWVIYAVINEYLNSEDIDESSNPLTVELTDEFARSLADKLDIAAFRVREAVDRLAKIQYEMLTKKWKRYSRRTTASVPLKGTHMNLRTNY